MFCPIVTVLGKCMATRYTAYSENLWRAAATVFNSIVNSGLPAVNKAYFNPQDLTPPASSWTCLAETLEWFLLGTYAVAADTALTGTALDDPATAEASAAESQSAAAPTSTPPSQNASTAAEPIQAPADLQTPVNSSQDAPPDTKPIASNTAAALSQQPEASTSAGDLRGGAATPSQDEASGSSPPVPPSQRSSRSQRSSKTPSRDASFKSAVADTEQSSGDAELETNVVDTLTDAVLTACSHAPQEVKRRLIAVLDQATVRPKNCHIPHSAAGAAALKCVQAVLIILEYLPVTHL